ncbi:MAG: hypothetical protein H6974_10950 [Gammaproteobacteria bacterium]|nr:hypothetical protein [Gammaproteobacteria bacterium]
MNTDELDCFFYEFTAPGDDPSKKICVARILDRGLDPQQLREAMIDWPEHYQKTLPSGFKLTGIFGVELVIDTNKIIHA